MSDQFSEAYTLYKAKKDGSGAASQWNLGSKKDCVFLEMSNQTDKDDKGNPRFDWKNRIKFKLGHADIGEILSVLVGMQKGVGPYDKPQGKHKGLYHSNDAGNSVLYFGTDDNGVFNIYLSVKRGEDRQAIRHTISKGEACVLSTLLRRAIEVMFRWH